MDIRRSLVVRLRSGSAAAFLAILFGLPSAATAVVPALLPCDGGTIQLRAGSELDYGWTGFAHDSELSAAIPFGFAVARRCTDDQSACEQDADCTNLQCEATCDCNADRTCEIAGPVGQKHCLSTLTDCETNADCGVGVPCLFMPAPPEPFSSTGVPTCTISSFDESLTGTADLATGEVQLSSTLRWRLFLGIAVDQPCPRCGHPASNPRLGDSSTCKGGQFDGAACTVDAVDAMFGGTSFDCPPELSANISGPGVAIRLDEMTTGTTTRTAELACANFPFRSNPLNSGSNPRCIDRRGPEDPLCASNADCKRCSDDATIACTSNVDCGGNGTCAEAPDQPITCGYWCNCGFCDGDAARPCFESSQCPDGQNCVAGPGTGTQPNAPQQKPNDCVNDGFICGQAAPGQCATTVTGSCSGQSYLPCPGESSECEDQNAGTCVLSVQPCFEPRITRSGSASPAGSYCPIEGTTCISNADCTADGDSCVSDVLAPRLEALFCSPSVSSAAVNNVYGITGPGALSWETFIRICRCGEGEAACGDVCGALEVCLTSNDGTPCNDGNACTEGESCSGGECGGGGAVDCDDEVECNGVETCSPQIGCIDGTSTCDDENPCTADICNEITDDCEVENNSAPCDDGLFCNGADSCSGGGCNQHAGDPCDGPGDADPDCSETCDEQAGACTGGDPDDSACSDMDSCTIGDKCAGASCIPGTVVDPGCVPTTTLPEGPLCGDWTGDGILTASDALEVLRGAVGIHACELLLCDYNGDGNVTSADALAVLRAAVSLPSQPNCPDEPGM